LREAALHVWGEKVYALPYFTGSGISSVNFFGAFVSPQVFWVLGVTAAIVIGLQAFFAKTLTGRSMRACSANRNAAILSGVNVKNMITLSFIISAGIGALAGCVTSPMTQTSYNCGAPLAIKGFTVAILGGLGNSTAAVVAGLILGVIEAFSISVLPLAYKDVIAISILLVILFFKPSGLFGNKEAGALKEF
jgi:branched-chain amino acid transport system permease protein